TSYPLLRTLTVLQCMHINTTCRNVPFLCIHCCPTPLDLPSFPTRRSSDLHRPRLRAAPVSGPAARQSGGVELAQRDRERVRADRSEEHTSELQSLTNIVCPLLLEKKRGDENLVVRVDDTTSSVTATMSARA